ncbi:hypothetical protein [Streptomyces albipurpureus]|uniref:Uncharacterized protein n=1 Tax=Streptomyces albipurpureus TaxID=2897419 RepID=A0ABT0UMF8_9ACTN|nr:hypothetical protein [Streptomyces sp. CWNU-1]MCM2388810.1 hypothetical protein [Streptomyces sp. CWNU-1]
MPQGSAVPIGETARLVPVFDPVLRNLAVQLWKDGDPAGIHGLGETYSCPDDVLDTLGEFLTEAGIRSPTAAEYAVLARELIMLKGGPDAALLTMAEKDPQRFLF